MVFQESWGFSEARRERRRTWESDSERKRSREGGKEGRREGGRGRITGYLRTSFLLRNFVFVSTVVRDLGLAAFVTNTATVLTLEGYRKKTLF